MVEKKTAGGIGEESLSPLDAYNIILQRHTSEDRILTERVTVFLGASSILFLAFVMSLSQDLTPLFRWLRIILPLVGIFLTWFLYSGCRASANALAFWQGAEEKIESETPDFKYMRERYITPRACGEDVINGEKKWVNIEGVLMLENRKRSNQWLSSPYFRSGSRFSLLQGMLLPLFLLFLALWSVSLALAILS